MAVPNTGALGLYKDIQTEIGGAQADTSLHDMSIEAGFSTPDAMSEFYGYVAAEPPSVTSSPATSVTDVSMTANGSLTNPSGVTTNYGFYFGTSTNRTSNPFYSVGNSSSTSFSFSRGFGGLSATTTYYYWAHASNDGGSSSGARITQTTLAAITYTDVSSPGIFVGGIGEYGTHANQNQDSQFRFQYQHPYYGYSNIIGYNSTWYGNGFCCGNYTNAVNINNMFWKRRTTSDTTSHRKYSAAIIGTNRSAQPTQTWMVTTGGPYMSFSNQSVNGSICQSVNDARAQASVGGTMDSSTIYGNGCKLIFGDYHGYADFRATAPGSSDIRLKTNINYL